jgi:hypothetical protein
VATHDRRIALRAPEQIWARVEKIQTAIARTGVSVKASEVLRMALDRGLDVLERKYRRRS